MARDAKNLIVALDIGTSKVACLVAELMPDGQLAILGMGGHESKGLKKGVVVNIEATVTAVQRALEEAELMADCKIGSAFVGIAGSHIRSFNSTGMVAIKDREVSALDVERAIDTARAVNIPTDQQILHVLRQEFIIDGQEDVREPIGMSGVRLEVKVHIVTGAVSAAQNIVKCVRRCGLEVNDLILQPLASSRAVLSEDEKDLGVCLVDIGGGTTDIAIFTHGAIRHTAVVPIAGDQVTNDIAMALRTPTADAENIKIRHGVALRQLADPNQMIDVPGIGERAPRAMSRQTLAEVIEPRVEELFSLVQQVLRESGFEELLSSGIVLTGGSATMQGMVELGEEIFHMPVRLGVPKYQGGLADVVRNPRYATALGLLLEGVSQVQHGQLSRQSGSVRAVFGRMMEWFQLQQFPKRQGENNMFEIVDNEATGPIIKVIGVGGAGGNALNHMIEQQVQGVEFIAVNTDAQVLSRNKAANQIQLGSSGLGAGAKPEEARAVALEDRERIEEAVAGAHMVFITAGMGGGTGTGAAPVIAEVARSLGILTVAVVTKPFTFEGSKRMKIAEQGLEELGPNVDSLIVILNDKLEEVLGEDVTQEDAFKAADDVLNNAVAGIAEIINNPGLVNVDFQDVKTVMSEQGMAMMGSASASGIDRARIAAEQAIACPLLEGVNLAGARGVLVNITASKSSLKLRETKEVMNIVRTFAAEDATIIYGGVYDDQLADQLRVTVVATGLGMASSVRQQKPQLVLNNAVGQKTGTDNMAGPINYNELNEVPAVIRRNRASQVEALQQSGVDKYDIPAFLRKQAD
jgi:cell division protein FtsA